MFHQQTEKRARMKFTAVRTGCVDLVNGAFLPLALVRAMGLDCIAIGR
jgi:hypothetical protein